MTLSPRSLQSVSQFLSQSCYYVVIVSFLAGLLSRLLGLWVKGFDFFNILIQYVV